MGLAVAGPWRAPLPPFHCRKGTSPPVRPYLCLTGWPPPMAPTRHTYSYPPFSPPDLAPFPPDHHCPPRAGQFWVLKGTQDTWGGIYQLVTVASLEQTDHLVQRWVTAGPRPRLYQVPRADTCVRPLGSRRPLPSSSFGALALSRVVVHRRGQAPHGMVIASFPERPAPLPDPHASLDGHFSGSP